MLKKQKRQKTEKKFEELTISDDFIFGIVMRNPIYCKTFLEIVLNIKIKKIEYPESQKVIDFSVKAKSIRLDIYVEDEKNTVFNVEMQTTTNRNLPKRTRYYQSMIDLNILDKGEDYVALKKTFVIFVCIFDPFGYGEYVYTFENTCKEVTNLRLKDETQKIFLNAKGKKGVIRKELKALLNYIDCNETSDTYTKTLESAVNEVKSNEKWRVEYMTYAMKLKDEYFEGVQEGMEKGEAKGESLFASLTTLLIKDARVEDLKKAAEDKEYREILYKEYGLKNN